MRFLADFQLPPNQIVPYKKYKSLNLGLDTEKVIQTHPHNDSETEP